jgi:hypothetical protein
MTTGSSAAGSGVVGEQRSSSFLLAPPSFPPRLYIFFRDLSFSPARIATNRAIRFFLIF